MVEPFSRKNDGIDVVFGDRFDAIGESKNVQLANGGREPCRSFDFNLGGLDFFVNLRRDVDLDVED